MSRLGGFPTDPPVVGTGRFRNFQEDPLSFVTQASIQCSAPSFRLSIVRIRVFESRREEGMMAKPSGSGPIHEINFQLFAKPARAQFPNEFQAATFRMVEPPLNAVDQ